jgi:hypothetical protein
MNPKAAFVWAGVSGLLLTLVLFFMIKEPDFKARNLVND